MGESFIGIWMNKQALNWLITGTGGHAATTPPRAAAERLTTAGWNWGEDFAPLHTALLVAAKL
jgi:hypothetical protein